MSTLLLRLEGPMQAWGDESKFEHRRTRREPTKSGVIGLVASALGRKRTDPIEDLSALRFGVRVDREGVSISEYDYQITRAAKKTRTGYIEAGYGEYEIEDKQTVLSYRYYLYDASFVAGLEGSRELLDTIAQALQHPMWPLFLGRRSCPPAGTVLIGLVDEVLENALHNAMPSPGLSVKGVGGQQRRYCVEVPDNGAMVYTQKDMPITFDKLRRQFAYRRVYEYYEELYPAGQAQAEHDPLAML